MTDDEIELQILQAYVERHKAAYGDPDKCARELDLREELASVTGKAGADLEHDADLWLRRLAPGRPGYEPGPLRRCSNSTLRDGAHRYHLRAFQGDTDRPAPAWDRIRELRRITWTPQHTSRMQCDMATSIRLFISHSSADVQLASLLIELLRAALNLPSLAIRCTSVDGYRLKGGADTNEQLRLEVHESETFIGIVSTRSLRSLYVLFELGARWGAKRSLVPLLAAGTPPEVLGGPLTGLNALRADNRSQLHQLVSELGVDLGITPEPPAVYQKQIDAILAIQPPAPEPTGSPSSQSDEQPPRVFPSIDDRTLLSRLSDSARELLLAAAGDRNATILVIDSNQGLQITVGGRSFVEVGNARSEAHWRRAVNDLADERLIEDPSGRGQVFAVSDDGFRIVDLIESS
jgi:hypothetical protein